MKKLIINYRDTEKRYAIVEDGMAEKIFVAQPKSKTAVGSIYLGIVEKVLPGMNAAFVQIGEGKSGFLPKEKLVSYMNCTKSKAEKEKASISVYVHQGEKVLVQVEKDADGTKGPRLTGIIELQGKHLVYMPAGNYVAVSKKISDLQQRQEMQHAGASIKKAQEGILFRTSAAAQSLADLQDELEQLRGNYYRLQEKAESLKKPAVIYKADNFIYEILQDLRLMGEAEVVVDDLGIKKDLEEKCDFPIHYYHEKEGIFSHYRLEHEVEQSLKRIVWLDNGAYLIFDEAEALTVIDVNTGKFSGKTDRRQTMRKTNELAAIEAAKQIKIRDIAGIILIDFIDMKEETDKSHIQRTLAAALQSDNRQTKLIGFTQLGIMQLTRKKTKGSISELMTKKCCVCGGTGKVLSAETVAFRLERELWEYRGCGDEGVLIELTADVAAVFSGENGVHKERMEEMLGMKILFLNVKADKPYYEIRQFGLLHILREKLH